MRFWPVFLLSTLTAAAADADRDVAQWALRMGGAVTLVGDPRPIASRSSERRRGLDTSFHELAGNSGPAGIAGDKTAE